MVGRVDRLPGCRGRKEVQFGPAADRHDDRVRADLEFAPQDGVRDDAPLRVEPDPLDLERLEAGNPSFPDKELLHRGGGEDLYPFGNRILHFPAESGHRLAGFQAGDRHVVDTEPDRHPGDVDRDVPPADDHQPAVDPAILGAPDAPQERQGVQESLVLPPDPREPDGFVRPDGQENGVEPPAGKVREGEVPAEPFPALEVDAARKDRLDVGKPRLVGKPEFRDGVPHHPPGLRVRVEDRGAAPQAGERVRRRKPGGAGPDHGDP